MTSKIELYREVLTDDPNSRVFFPLARMLAELGETGEAVSVLKKAMGFHPGHLEARFLLVELLTRLNREDEAETAFEGLASLLSNYPSVWTLWAAKAPGLSRDSTLALKFLALSLQGKNMSWMDLLEKGLSTVSDQVEAGEDESSSGGGTGASSGGFSLRGADEVLALAKQIEAQEHRAAAEQLPPECSAEAAATVKTRTMADLLARHGDYVSALEIYGELQQMASSDQDKKNIAARLNDIKAQMASGVAPVKSGPAGPPKSKAKLVSMLEALANRLDARATA